jgi:hypothetical protein
MGRRRSRLAILMKMMRRLPNIMGKEIRVWRV